MLHEYFVNENKNLSISSEINNCYCNSTVLVEGRYGMFGKSLQSIGRFAQDDK